MHSWLVNASLPYAILTFQVNDFSQLKNEKKVWHSPQFTIADKIRVRLAVFKCHVSLSLIAVEFVNKGENMRLQYNVSVGVKLQHELAITKSLELCYPRGNRILHGLVRNSAYFHFLSHSWVLQSEEQFLEIEEAHSLQVSDWITLELKLLEHHHSQ